MTVQAHTNSQLCLRLAGVSILFQSDSPDIKLTPAPVYLPAQRLCQTPEVCVKVFVQPPPPEHPAEELLFSTGLWSISQQPNQQILRTLARQVGEGDGNITCILNDQTDECALYVSANLVRPNGILEVLPQFFDEMFALLLLAHQRGALLHCSAINLEGKGIIFSGMSGAGKSTISALWKGQPGASPLSDERGAVRKVQGHYHLFGTSWQGRLGFGSFDDAPLEHIYILQHAPKNELRPLSPTQAASLLIARSFSPFWDAESMNFVLNFITDMCQSVPCHELGFVPDQSVVDFLR